MNDEIMLMVCFLSASYIIETKIFVFAFLSGEADAVLRDPWISWLSDESDKSDRSDSSRQTRPDMRYAFLFSSLIFHHSSFSLHPSVTGCQMPPCPPMSRTLTTSDWYFCFQLIFRSIRIEKDFFQSSGSLLTRSAQNFPLR